MKLVTASQMQKLDKAAIQGHKIPSLTLMERAGSGVADLAWEHARNKKGAVIVICGRGNNGGDGLVAARLLIEKGAHVEVFITGKSSELSADSKANWEKLVPLTTHIYEISSFEELKYHHPVIAGSSVILDSIFGTGLQRNLAGVYAEIVEYINILKNFVIAVDIPSGLSADTGKALGIAVKANKTITFGLPKIGLHIGESSKYAGTVSVLDIGIPDEEVTKVDTKYFLTDPSELKDLLPKRPSDSHKGKFGHVAVIAGAGGKLGAGYLSSHAALRTGAGLVTYFLPASAFEKFDARYPEIMSEPVADKGRGYFHPDGAMELSHRLKDKTVAALGPAIGTHKETLEFQKQLISTMNLPMVIDADGLNNLDLSQLKRIGSRTVITPHPGEFSRLIKLSTQKIQDNRFSLCLNFAHEHRTNLLLKGHNTIVASPDGTAYINPTGNPAMASAGMGDALTGLIAGFIAQEVKPFMSAVAGAYIHGLAGDIAAEEIGSRGIVASDIIKRIPMALDKIFNED
jgi:hydroxyethylthiazole kinase-like uncharacterized protein yjeF